MENESHIAKGLKQASVLVGTIDSYLIYRLTAGKKHVTEASNASRTLFVQLPKGTWDTDLLELMQVPNNDILPEILDSAGEFGKSSGLSFLPDAVPITGVLGDQQAALAGQACFEKGESKCTYGTGAFALSNIGNEWKACKHGLLSTVAWSLNQKPTYAIEGSCFIAGAAVQFIRDNLNFIKAAKESDRVGDFKAAPDLYFVPALAGLGSPHWNPRAKGCFMGLTRDTCKEQLIRATLEGIAFQVNELLESMSQEAGQKLTHLKVDGQATSNNLLMQTQANISNILIDRPRNLETTAFGAGLFAALGIGLYSDLNEMKQPEKQSSNLVRKILIETHNLKLGLRL